MAKPSSPRLKAALEKGSGEAVTAARAAVGQVREALGHLQAFELRPIGELDVAVVHEADWAHAHP